MNLVIDIGNSYWKVALFKENSLQKRAEIAQGSHLFLANFLENNTPNAIAFSSVRETFKEEKRLLSTFGKVYSFSSSDPLPLTLRYHTPETLGTDRIAGAVYASSTFPGKDCLVITIGTCITCDLITAQGIYEGGTISPGPTMRLQAMHHFTGKLPPTDFQADVPLPGKSTAQCMASGTYYGILAEITHYIHHYKQQYKGLHVILSGGFMHFFEKKIKYPIFAQNDIVLRGL
ncbi:MAG: pantothenate kinase, partial [Bacteroidetes bacterium]